MIIKADSDGLKAIEQLLDTQLKSAGISALQFVNSVIGGTGAIEEDTDEDTDDVKLG